MKSIVLSILLQISIFSTVAAGGDPFSMGPPLAEELNDSDPFSMGPPLGSKDKKNTPKPDPDPSSDP